MYKAALSSHRRRSFTCIIHPSIYPKTLWKQSRWRSKKKQKLGRSLDFNFKLCDSVQRKHGKLPAENSTLKKSLQLQQSMSRIRANFQHQPTKMNFHSLKRERKKFYFFHFFNETRKLTSESLRTDVPYLSISTLNPAFKTHYLLKGINSKAYYMIPHLCLLWLYN